MTIRFIQPYSYDLQIGDAINQDVARLPDDAWIVHCDHDTLKPPGFAERIREVLKTGIAKNVVLTCRTNRVGQGNPALVKEYHNEDSITRHLSLAKSLWDKHGTKITPTKVAAGYCMIFHKMHWISLGGLPASKIDFDRWLSLNSAPYLMEGVYIIHLYRWGKKDPRRHYKHLLVPGSYLNE